jgi:hypothetical protein
MDGRDTLSLATLASALPGHDEGGECYRNSSSFPRSIWMIAEKSLPAKPS